MFRIPTIRRLRLRDNQYAIIRFIATDRAQTDSLQTLLYCNAPRNPKGRGKKRFNRRAKASHMPTMLRTTIPIGPLNPPSPISYRLSSSCTLLYEIYSGSVEPAIFARHTVTTEFPKAPFWYEETSNQSFFFFFWSPFLCVSGYRTPRGTSSMYKIIVVAMCGKVVKCRVISPITGLSLRNVYCGVSDERGNSAPGCHRGM